MSRGDERAPSTQSSLESSSLLLTPLALALLQLRLTAPFSVVLLGGRRVLLLQLQLRELLPKKQRRLYLPRNGTVKFVNSSRSNQKPPPPRPPNTHFHCPARQQLRTPALPPPLCHGGGLCVAGSWKENSVYSLKSASADFVHFVTDNFKDLSCLIVIKYSEVTNFSF